MLDESLLDDPEALARADRHGLLHGAAEAGARVRTASRYAHEAGLAELRPDGRPRALLVAGPGPVASCAADLLGAFSNGAVPVTLLDATGPSAAPAVLRWALPGWAGPLDLLLIVTPDGTEPGLSTLVEQAYRRGCTVVAVSPAKAPLAETVGQSRGMAVPVAEAPYELAEHTVQPAAPGTLWALLTPLLILTDRLGLSHAPPDALQALADRLDQVAERCGPAVALYTNPAKTLAAELADALPLLWSESPVAGAAARHFATTLAALAGRPALAAGLPEALTTHGTLLTGALAGAGSPDDFFRDRVEEPQGEMRARVVLLREGAPAGTSAATAARDLAYAHDTALSELEPLEGSSPVEAAAELIATTDFAAVYLTLTASE
ncbi:SIS domain-containing protein [Streptomyces gobiensis]|uniref:SIS domain-containing protein n=1 Tax=Streptomyces gobiensis TaxID=2875706 RepID=UPI001E506DED|nr:SIS domain-containing protein [Streptomyces gobiensis]UGY91757.1 mannose-6-phosphate isomerase [Streptomyces gobiensis]